MRVLVTGGAGFVGSHVARELARSGHEVELLDDLSTGRRENAERLGLKLHELDVRDLERVSALLAERRTEAVVHAAARAIVSESVARPELYFEANVRGGLALLEALRRTGVGRLVVSSTAAVYGAPEVGWIEESSPFRPLSPYGATKAAFEVAVELHERAHGLRAVRLRYFNAAGAHEEGDLAERHEPETHLVPRLVAAARSGEPFTIHGSDYDTPDGTAVRDLVHVQDLARAHVLALERLDAVAGRAINLGSGNGCSVLKAVAAVERVLGKKIALERAPRRPGDPPRLVAKVGLARELLGWTATRDLDAIVRDAARALGVSTQAPR